jgi:LacI family transcriptional regulator
VNVRLKDIAQQAGVSEATVSRALSSGRSSMVRAETLARIRRIADALGYYHNPHAQALAMGRSAVVSLVVAYTEDYMMNVKALRLHSALLDAGLQAQIIPAQSLEALDSVDRIAAHLLRAAPMAVAIRPLATNWRLELLEELCRTLWDSGVYALLADSHQLPGDDVPADAVSTDRVSASEAAVCHLLEMGHRRVGLLASPDQTFGRIAGYRRALDEHGIGERYEQSVDRYVEYAPARPYLSQAVQAGCLAAQELLRRCPEVTALFCCSDLVAIGAMHGLTALGLSVPADVAVVGFNDEPWCSHLPVPLTTIGQPVEQLATRAADMLKLRLAGDDSPWRRELVPMPLIARASCGQGLAGSRRGAVLEAAGRLQPGG